MLSSIRKWAEEFGTTANSCLIYEVLKRFDLYGNGSKSGAVHLVGVHRRDSSGDGQKWFRAACNEHDPICYCLPEFVVERLKLDTKKVCVCCNNAPGTIKWRNLPRFQGDKGLIVYLCRYDYARYMWGQSHADKLREECSK